jgi:hypothetical protein
MLQKLYSVKAASSGKVHSGSTHLVDIMLFFFALVTFSIIVWIDTLKKESAIQQTKQPPIQRRNALQAAATNLKSTTPLVETHQRGST